MARLPGRGDQRLAPYGDEYRTEASVRHLASEILAPINAKTARPESTDTVMRFIKDVYLVYCKATLRPSTHAGYEWLFKILEPHLGDCLIRDFRAVEGERTLADPLEEYRELRFCPVRIRCFFTRMNLKTSLRYNKRMPQILCAALLLDMDGVLVDSTPAVARVWTRWALKHNMDPGYVVQFAHGRPSLPSIQELLPNADHTVHLEENRWMERGEIEDIADVVALPGAKELLATVPPAQFAVVTSATSLLAEVRLRAAGLWPQVAHLVTANDILRGKPNPEPYLKGAAAVHRVPQDCLVVEDAPSGVRSGKAAGAHVLAVCTTTPNEGLLAAGADWIANDCSSLRRLPSPHPGKLLFELSVEHGHR